MMSSSLRSWQDSCITRALEHFTVTPHFFCQATPGAGKTRMAAELASRLLEQDCGFHGHLATHSMSIWPPIPR